MVKCEKILFVQKEEYMKNKIKNEEEALQEKIKKVVEKNQK